MNLPVVLKLNNVSKEYFRRGEGMVRVLHGISLEVLEGRCVTILGPSGVGKSTFLNIIAGLEPPTRGEVLVDGKKDISQVSFVFQQPALLPWRTVLENVALPLELSGVSEIERRERAGQALASVGLGDFGKSFPHTLSGGMKSRVAIARAMIQNPRLLLMDEPFSGLDPIMRETFDINLMRFCSNRNITSVFVTHDVTEACLLAHEVLVMDEGKFVASIKVDLPWPRTREILVHEKFTAAVREVRTALLGTSMASTMPKPRYLKDLDVFIDPFETPPEKEPDDLP